MLKPVLESNVTTNNNIMSRYMYSPRIMYAVYELIKKKSSIKRGRRIDNVQVDQLQCYCCKKKKKKSNVHIIGCGRRTFIVPELDPNSRHDSNKQVHLTLYVFKRGASVFYPFTTNCIIHF